MECPCIGCQMATVQVTTNNTFGMCLLRWWCDSCRVDLILNVVEVGGSSLVQNCAGESGLQRGGA